MRSAPIFAPNPPPTSGVITWTCLPSTPSHPATSSRAVCAACVEHQSVTRPSAPHSAAAARVSSGAAARRWLTISRVTTTSQPSKRSASKSVSWSNPLDVLVPAAGKSSTSSVAAALRLMTTGSGS